MRNFTDYETLLKAIAACGWQISEVVSGGASGVDALGERWGHENMLPVTRFPADWGKHGNAAGPIRNREMASYAHALVAIWDGKSRGTSNMIDEARRRNLTVVVHGVNGYTPTRI